MANKLNIGEIRTALRRAMTALDRWEEDTREEIKAELEKEYKNKKIKISTLEIANALVAKYNKENNTDFEVVDGLTTFTDDDFELIDFDEEEPEPPAPLQHPWNPLFTSIYGVFNIGISFEHAWKFLGTIIS